nr:MAG TPA: hypothetical protein [Caudoviricetes sp.]
MSTEIYDEMIYRELDRIHAVLVEILRQLERMERHGGN